jgi:predicted nuclease of predicted toxin-antitoxin system
VRLLADECLDGRLVAWLRGQGHDVVAIGDAHPGIRDRDVMALAVREDRIVVTEDKDFGEIAVRAGGPIPGIILLRDVGPDVAEVTAAVRAVLDDPDARLRGGLAVIRRGRIRLRQLPQA